jgi:4-azaleucine resistance transporter AzlC
MHRRATILFSLKTTLPVFLGYSAIGLAFGLLLQRSGFPWYLATIMSVLIYAGAAQFLAVGMFTGGAGLVSIAVATLLVNARHMVYGLSMLDRFSDAGRAKPYLVFALTDETYAVLTSTRIPPDVDRRRAMLYISALDQSYWVLASTFGALAGTFVPIDTQGLEFALNALFMVLLIEQWKIARSKLPFVIAGLCTLAAYLLAGPENMLIAAIVASIVVLLLLRRRLPEEAID